MSYMAELKHARDKVHAGPPKCFAAWDAAEEFGKMARRHFVKAAGEAVPSQGGFLVPSFVLQAIARLKDRAGVFGRNARRVTVSSDASYVPKPTAGLTAAIVDENAAISDSRMTFAQISLSLRKWAVLTLASFELMEDDVAGFGDLIATEIAYALARNEDVLGFSVSANGSSTFGGFVGLSYAMVGLAGAITAASNNDTNAEYTIADYSAVIAALPDYAMQNAKWYCSAVHYGASMARLSGTAGGDLSNLSFLGFPVELTSAMNTSTGDQSAVVVALLGDLSLSSILATRNEIRMRASDDRYFEYDQVGVRATERLAVVHHGIGDASTVGAVTALVGQ